MKSPPPPYQPAYPTVPTVLSSPPPVTEGNAPTVPTVMPMMSQQPTTNATVIALDPNPVNPLADCSRCGRGQIHREYCTCCGVCWSILLFPFGLLCLLCCRKTWCTVCGRH